VRQAPLVVARSAKCTQCCRQRSAFLILLGYIWLVPFILLVGEDDAFPMYAEYLRHRGLDVAVHTSPGEALTELVQLSPAVIVTELAFGQDPQRGCEFIAAVRQQPSSRNPRSSSLPVSLAHRMPHSPSNVVRISFS
jgi:hypothetical protein